MAVTVSLSVLDWKISININMDIDGDLQAISFFGCIKMEIRTNQIKGRKDSHKSRFTVSDDFLSWVKEIIRYENIVVKRAEFRCNGKENLPRILEQKFWKVVLLKCFTSSFHSQYYKITSRNLIYKFKSHNAVNKLTVNAINKLTVLSFIYFKKKWKETAC